MTPALTLLVLSARQEPFGFDFALAAKQKYSYKFTLKDSNPGEDDVDFEGTANYALKQADPKIAGNWLVSFEIPYTYTVGDSNESEETVTGEISVNARFLTDTFINRKFIYQTWLQTSLVLPSGPKAKRKIQDNGENPVEAKVIKEDGDEIIIENTITLKNGECKLFQLYDKKKRVVLASDLTVTKGEKKFKLAAELVPEK